VARRPSSESNGSKKSPVVDATRGSQSTSAAEGERPVSSTHRAAFTAPGLEAGAGAQVADELQGRLAAMIDLSMTLKHIHWNVVGPAFIGVHTMLDPQYAGVALMVDALAERIATLGGVPNGLPGAIVAARDWDDYSLGRADTQAHLGALDLVYAGVIGDHREAIDIVDDLDPVSGDLLITQTGLLEEYHWFVRSHLEDYAGGLSNAGTTTELGAATAAMRRKATRITDDAVPDRRPAPPRRNKIG
jgi:starvation-inducible DNA-binding protein